MTRHLWISATLSLIVVPLAQAAKPHAVCQVLDESIIGHSPTGIPEVSNLQLVELQCNIPARPFPSKPGESRNGLRAAATAVYKVPDGGEQETPVEVNVTGGGGGNPGAAEESVWFSVDLPLDQADREAEAKRFITELEQAAAQETHRQDHKTEEEHQRAIQFLSEHWTENKIGLFVVTCDVTDGDDVLGTGTVEFEVLFKGRGSDVTAVSPPPNDPGHRVSH